MLNILLGTNEPILATAVPLGLKNSFASECEVHCTVKAGSRDIRRALSLYDFDVIILLAGRMRLDCDSLDPFTQTVELVRELRKRIRAAVVVSTSLQRPGFLTDLEQAGADGLLDAASSAETMKETIQNALEARRVKAEEDARKAESERKRTGMRPRVLLLDDDPTMLELLAILVRNCWREATIVSCTDSRAAWAELQRTAPDLFITDLVHGGMEGVEMLGRLAEQGVNYPIVVLSGALGELGEAARTAAGPNLRVTYLWKPIPQDTFVEQISALIEPQNSAT